MHHLRRCGHLFALLGALAICTFAYGDEISEAKRAFVSGMKHFDLGEYGAALADFKDGYRAKEDPVFLYNIAQCYRMMNQKRDAIRYYRLYVSRAPDASNRSEIDERIAKLQTEAENEEKAHVSPQAGTSPSSTHEAAVPQPTTTLLATAPVVPAKTPVYKKWWLWTIVGVVAVGAGIGLGIGLTRGSKPLETTFPTVGF